MPLLDQGPFGAGESGRLAQCGMTAREAINPKNTLSALSYEDV
jgi:hypothetical protein